MFVMGDNRGGSQDSRALGPIHEDELVGRAVSWSAARHWQMVLRDRRPARPSPER